MKIVDIEPIMRHPLFQTWKKKELVNALKQAEEIPTECFCTECNKRDTNACPAYDAPMRRTSLRIRGCIEGERVFSRKEQGGEIGVNKFETS